MALMMVTTGPAGAMDHRECVGMLDAAYDLAAAADRSIMEQGRRLQNFPGSTDSQVAAAKAAYDGTHTARRAIKGGMQDYISALAAYCEAIR